MKRGQNSPSVFPPLERQAPTSFPVNALSENRPWRLKSSVALFSLSALDFPPGILLGFSSSSPSVKSSPVFPLLHHPEGNPPLSRSSEGRPKKPTRPLPRAPLGALHPSLLSHLLPRGKKIPRALLVSNSGNPPPHPHSVSPHPLLASSFFPPVPIFSGARVRGWGGGG